LYRFKIKAGVVYSLIARSKNPASTLNFLRVYEKASTHKIESALGEVRNEWPEMQISLHLHDIRVLAVANA